MAASSRAFIDINEGGHIPLQGPTHVAVLVFHDKTIAIPHPYLPFPTGYSAPPPPPHSCPACAGATLTISSMLGVSGTFIFFEDAFLDRDHRFLHSLIRCFHVSLLKWHTIPSTRVPYSRNIALTMFQCSIIEGNYMYLAGGAQRSSLHDHWHGLRSTYRMHVDTDTWDVLPDMHMKRANAAMVAIKGCVYVIGGQTFEKGANHGIASSGEVWDPSVEGSWTLVPELWPMEVFGKQAPKVVVVSDTLFAIRTSSCVSTKQDEELMHYQSDMKVWTSLGPVDSPSIFCTSCGPWTCHKLFSISNNQIWVLLVSFCSDKRRIDHERITMCMMACKPLRPHPVQWSLLPTNITRRYEPLPQFIACVDV